ncbi:MAG: hypothetical protein V1736_08170 [Pseudomonadota bacterium]
MFTHMNRGKRSIVLVSFLIVYLLLALQTATEASMVEGPLPSEHDIYAAGNSLCGGTPLDTGVDLQAGNRLTIWADPNDTWSAGPDPRTSNANGLYNFPEYSYAGQSFRYGSLIGQIGSNAYFFVGTSYDQTVNDSGRLYLLYWDSNNSDNSGYITAGVQATPLPGAFLLLGSGLVGLVALRKRNR